MGRKARRKHESEIDKIKNNEQKKKKIESRVFERITKTNESKIGTKTQIVISEV